MKQQILSLALLLLILVGGCAQQTQQQTMPAQVASQSQAVVDGTSNTMDAATRAVTTTQSADAPASGGRLQMVKERGKLVCGVYGKLPGFSLETNGAYSGFDVDFCRVIATAIFGDPNAVEFKQFDPQDRFAAVQDGTVDVLFRNSTWTFSRNVVDKLAFGPVTFYDSQGIMLPAREGNIDPVRDLAGATVCVQSDTTNEANIRDFMRANSIQYDLFMFDNIDKMYAAYEDKQCDAVTSDRSSLVARRTLLKNPEGHVILDARLSKEPLAPVMAQGDEQWNNVITWSVYATIQAEEFGISSSNVAEFLNSDVPRIRRFLGLEGSFGADLGLDNDFVLSIIQNVGNYAEIYNRDLGTDTPFKLERGLNALWTDGGVLYSPPFQ